MKEPEYITIEDAEKLATATDNDNSRRFVRILTYTGARISEILALTTQDVNLDEDTLDIPHLKQKAPKPTFIFRSQSDGKEKRISAHSLDDASTRLPDPKSQWIHHRTKTPEIDQTSPRRRIPIAAAIRADVSAALTSTFARRRSGPVDHTQTRRLFFFTRLTGYRIIRDASLATGIRTQAGKLVHPHALRHTFAINWVKRGGDIKKLQKMLGHSNPATTDIYLRFAPKDIGIELDKVFKQEGIHNANANNNNMEGHITTDPT